VNVETRDQVRALISGVVEKWLADSIPAEELERIATEGVSPSGLLAPFHDALVPGITLLGERSFSTRLGNLHERIAAAVATEAHAEVHQPHDLSGAIPVLSREFITQRLSALEHRQAEPDTQYEPWFEVEALRARYRINDASTNVTGCSPSPTSACGGRPYAPPGSPRPSSRAYENQASRPSQPSPAHPCTPPSAAPRTPRDLSSYAAVGSGDCRATVAHRLICRYFRRNSGLRNRAHTASPNMREAFS
jgi:hypothetical protein